MKDAYFQPVNGPSGKKNPLLVKNKCTCPQDGMRLLIVDSIVQTYTPMKLFFEKHGSQVDFATTGQQAIGLCEKDMQKKCCKQYINVVIINAGLPDMNGCQVVRQIRDKMTHSNA